MDAEKILTMIIVTLPQVIAIVIYFVRIETRLTKIQTDISWMNKRCNECQPSWEDHTQQAG